MDNRTNPDHIFNPALIIDPNNNPFSDFNSLVSRKFKSVKFSDGNISDLVNLYYQIQNTRDSISSMTTTDLSVYSSYLSTLEELLTESFRDFNFNSVTGKWAVSQDGIGHAMSAALLSILDITKSPSVTNLWKFAGLDPNHTKWNPLVKNISWKIGMSFQHFSQYDTFYGNIYLNDFNRRQSMNQKTKDESEVVPTSRLEAQARRYATKIFMSHWHHIRYREVYGVDPVMNHSSSTRYIQPPNFPF